MLKKRLDYDRGLILLANSNKTRLIARGGFGYKHDQLNKFMSSDSGFHLDKKESKGVFVLCFNKKKPFLVNEVQYPPGFLFFSTISVFIPAFAK